MLSPYVIVAIQSSLGLVMFATLFRQHVLGRLQRADAYTALAVVLMVHGLRFLGLTMLAPGQVDPGQDMDALRVIAFGDLSAATVGIVAALAAYRRSPLTVPLAWLLTVVGLGDIVLVSVTVAGAGVLESGIGVMWITFGLVVPLLVLSHGYVVYALLRRRDELSPAVVKTSLPPAVRQTR
ncbi:hypothetical protein [Jannaschia sp. R86511]|uniref:hypothetical protein n=1 Tax=Jannaschia sp. R86511 TaxID=3093853 RepID=UPI0036D41756